MILHVLHLPEYWFLEHIWGLNDDEANDPHSSCRPGGMENVENQTAVVMSSASNIFSCHPQWRSYSFHCQFMESLWKSIIQLPIEFCWRGWDDHHLSDVFMCFHVLVPVKTLLGAKPFNISLLKPFFCTSHYHLHCIFCHFQSRKNEKHQSNPINNWVADGGR
jgi:hypothetical protein